MAWFQSVKNFFARHGEHTRFAAKHVLCAALPGGSIVAEVVDKVLGAAHNVAKNAVEAEGRAKLVASAAELERVGKVLDELSGRLAPLVEKVVHEDNASEADKVIRRDLATDPAVREGFRTLAGFAGRFDALEHQNRMILTKLGYGQDVLETLLGLMRRQAVVVDYVEELLAAGVRGKQLAGLLERVQTSAHELTARPAEVNVELVALNNEQPTGVVMELSAVSAVLLGELPMADVTLSRAAKLRPADAELADLSRRVTKSITEGDTDSRNERLLKSGSPSNAPKVGSVIGGWRLTHLLGQGGGGQVFRAERDGHVRALKMLLPELSGDRVFQETFTQEILTLSRLHDGGERPHLVKFGQHSFDQEFGCWWFTMEFIEGQSLQTKLDRDGPLSPRTAVEIFLKLAGEGGLAAAHAKGITHRDIKPANILLRASDGSPVLVDFGLALGGGHGMTTVQRVTGYTAKFAAPEQLRHKPTTPRSDVFSLTATLYYAATKHDPDDFDPVLLPKELQLLREVFEKGLAKRPEVRSESAQAWFTLLQKVPIDELPNLGGGKGAVTVSPPRKRENVKLPGLPPGLWTSCLQNTHIATLSGHTSAVRSVAWSPDGKVLATGCDDKMARLWSADGKYIATLSGHTYGLCAVAWNPDGKMLATGGHDCLGRLWSADGKHIATLTEESAAGLALAWSPDGKIIATGSNYRTARLWSADGKQIATLSGHGDYVWAVAWSPDGKVLATGSGDTTVRLWSADGKHITTLSGHSARVCSVAWSPDGKSLATGGDDKTVRLWSADGKHITTLSGHSARVCSVAWSPDRRVLATGSEDKTVRLWSADGKHIATLSEENAAVLAVAWSPDGRVLAIGCHDNTVLRLIHASTENPDWSTLTPTLPARPIVSITRSGNGLVYPGDYLWFSFSIENIGKGDISQLWAEMKSPSSLLDGLIGTIGRIKPTEKADHCLAILLPHNTPAGRLIGTLNFHEGNGFSPAARPIAFTLHPLPRPDFLIRWRLVNDGSGSSFGSGDGQPKRGESIEIHVSVENQTGEDLEGLKINLKPLTVPQGVCVFGPADDLGPLKDGESSNGVLAVCSDPHGMSGQASFELRAETADGRTFAVEKIETTIA